MAASPQIIKKAGPPPPVISTEAKRSGEISPSAGTDGIEAGDLSTQSIMGAIPICLPCRHAAPLEMTVAADTSIVISTEAKRSGEISSSDGTGGITVGDLSTQSIMGAVLVCLP